MDYIQDAADALNLPTTTPQMREVAKRMRIEFKYKSDGKIDRWSIGKMIGDCEDFALTTLYLLLGSKAAVRKALLSGEAAIIRTEARPGIGHAVLFYKGFYIDNIYRGWSRSFMYKKHDTYSKSMLLLKLTFGSVVG